MTRFIDGPVFVLVCGLVAGGALMCAAASGVIMTWLPVIAKALQEIAAK